MSSLQIPLHSLGAEHPPVDGELLPRLEPHDLLVLHLELQAALQAAEAAVGLDKAIGLAVLPSAGGGVGKVGAEPFDQRFGRQRQGGHKRRITNYESRPESLGRNRW